MINIFSFLFKGQLYGHTHKDKIKLQELHDVYPPKPTNVPQSFVLLNPSITPIEENNPAFRLFSLDKRSLNLLDYSQYYMDLTLSNGKLVFWIM